jgi:hypothetical protein
VRKDAKAIGHAIRVRSEEEGGRGEEEGVIAELYC